MNYLFDTNIISELIARQPNKEVLDWIDGLDPDTVYLSVITIGELRKGIEKLPPSKKRDAVKEWLETDLLIRFQGRIVVITVEVMLVWGELTGQLERQGKPLPALDSLIAAIVRHGNFALVTRNEDDFLPTGITVINPWKLL